MDNPKKAKPKKVLIDLESIRITEYDDRNVQLQVIRESGTWSRVGFYSSILLALRAIQSKELLVDYNQVHDFMSYMQGIERANAQIKEVLNKHDL